MHGDKPNSVRTLPLYARFVCTGNKPNSVEALRYTLGLFAPEINLIVWGHYHYMLGSKNIPDSVCIFSKIRESKKYAHIFCIKILKPFCPTDNMSGMERPPLNDLDFP